MDHEGAGSEGSFSAQFIESNSVKWEPFCEFFGIGTFPKTTTNTIQCGFEHRTTRKFDETEIVAKARKYRCDRHYERCEELISKQFLEQFEAGSIEELESSPRDITDTGLRNFKKQSRDQSEYCFIDNDNKIRNLIPYRKKAFDQLGCFFEGPEIDVISLKEKINDGRWTVVNFPEFYPCLHDFMFHPNWNDLENCSSPYQEIIMGRITPDYSAKYGAKKDVYFDSRIRKITINGYKYDELNDQFILNEDRAGKVHQIDTNWSITSTVNESCELFQ